MSCFVQPKIDLFELIFEIFIDSDFLFHFYCYDFVLKINRLSGVNLHLQSSLLFLILIKRNVMRAITGISFLEILV